MKRYSEAYYEDGSPILGNLDGQFVFHAKNYRRTKFYQALKRGRYKNGHVVSNKAHHWKLVNVDGSVIETIQNPNYKAPA